MKKIRIKVKHLLYIVMSMIILAVFILPSALFIYAEAAEKNDVETSKVYYKRYIDMFPFGTRRAEALYNLANSIIPEDFNSLRYTIFSNGSSSLGKVITGQMIDNAVSFYREIMERYQNSKYYEKSYGRLLNVLVLGGRFTEAEKAIDEGLASDNENIQVTALKFKIQSLIIGRHYEEAGKLGENLVDEGKADSDIYMLLGDINLYDRNLDDAEKYYKKAAEAQSYSRAEKDTLIMGSNLGIDPSQRLELIKKMKDGYMGSGEIHGHITINGKPAPFAHIYLKSENYDIWINGISVGDEGRYVEALTDYKGDYIIPSLPEGNYIAGIGVPTSYLDNTLCQTSNYGYIHLKKGESKNYDVSFVPPMKFIKPDGNVIPLDNKVELEWEKVPGAAYYNIMLIAFEKPGKMEETYVTFAVENYITGTKYALDINKVNLMGASFMMDDAGMLNPQAYLGAFYPGGRVPIIVDAFSSDGRLITSTRSIISKIKDMAVVDVPDENLSEGDRLILDRKPEEAVKAYEKALEKNPDDIHSMMVLSKLYTLGTKRKYKQGEGEVAEGTNTGRARELLERLYIITRENYYRSAQFGEFILEHQDYREAIEKYKSIPESELDEDDFIRIADLCLMVKDYSEAEKYYEKVYELRKATNYNDLAPVLLKIIREDIEGSLRFLQILNQNLYRVDKDTLYSDITKLNNIDKTTSEYKKFQEAIEVLLSFKSDRKYREKFMNIYESLQTPLLSDILKDVGGFYSVFDAY